MDFEFWLKEVDLNVQNELHLSIHDLPDYCWMDLFEAGETPKNAADEFICNSGDF